MIPLTVYTAGALVLVSYALNIPHTNYLSSPLWAGTPQAIRRAMLPLQVAAAVGFCALTWEAYKGKLREPMEQGKTAIIVTFLLASACWAFLTNMSMQGRLSVLWPIICLQLVFASSVLMLVGAYRGESPYALWGAFVVAGVCLCDASGWCSTLIW